MTARSDLTWSLWLLAIASLCSGAHEARSDITRAEVARLDPWSRNQVTLGSSGIPRRLTLTEADFATALWHSRPHAVSAAGGVASYQRTMSLRELHTFTGLVYEQDLARLFNEQYPASAFRVGRSAHPFMDLEQVDPETHRVIATYQAYAGREPRSALRKLLLSDRDADRVVVTADVYQGISQAVRECEALHEAAARRQIDALTMERQIRRRCARVGLRYDAADRSLYAEGAQYGRGTLGRLGTPEIQAGLSRLMLDPDGRTSQQLAQAQFRNQLTTNDTFHGVASSIADNDSLWDALFQNRGALAAVPAAPIAELTRAIRLAELQGVSAGEIQAILLGALRTNAPAGEQAAIGRVHLLQASETAYQKSMMRSHNVLRGFVLIGALLDYELSDEDLAMWLKSGKLAEWGVRQEVAVLSHNLFALVEKRSIEVLVSRSPSAEFGRAYGSKLLRIRMKGLGAATAVFVAGEGLIGVFRGENAGEVAVRMQEALVVMVIAESTVMGSETIVASKLGAFGGPLTFAAAIATTVAYEGLKYAWTARREQDADLRVYLARCETARETIRGWSQRIQALASVRTRR